MKNLTLSFLPFNAADFGCAVLPLLQSFSLPLLAITLNCSEIEIIPFSLDIYEYTLARSLTLFS